MRGGLGLNIGWWVVSVLVGMIGAVSVWAAEPHAKPVDAAVRPAVAGAQATDEQRNAEVRVKLAKRTNAEFIETPLSQVLDFFRDAADIQIYTKTRALDDVGIGTDIPMTCNLKDVTVETALELILDDLQLDFAVDRGLVIVSTADDLQAKMVVRAYPLQTLLADVAPEQIDREAGRLAGIIAEQIAPETWGAVEAGAHIPVVGHAAPGMMMGGTAGMGGGAAPMASAPGMPGGIPGSVHLGGPGAISLFHRTLIVRNSIKVQDQVDRFLRMLAEGKALVK